MQNKEKEKHMAKQKFIDRLFPVKYDFYKMLESQAGMNLSGVESLCRWLEDMSGTEDETLLQEVMKADEIRMNLEKNLILAFSTPFDRGDIYSISVGMDKVIEYAKSTCLSMQAYGIKANETITCMVENLRKGTAIFADAIASLKNAPQKSGREIAGIRATHSAIEEQYRNAMAVVFKSNDPMNAFKQREVYHHIKDASTNLEEAVDILHRIVVRLT